MDLSAILQPRLKFAATAVDQIPMKTLSWSNILLVTLCSCSGGGSGDFGANIGVNKDQSSGKKDEEAFDDENAPADEPTEVSGAFLSMAFMEGQSEAQARIKNNPNGKIEIAVCLRDKRSLECIDQSGLDMSWEIVTAEKRYEPLVAQPAPASVDFHEVLLVPIKHLAGTVLVKIDEQATGKDAMRARTLLSVGEFGAKHGRVAPGTLRAKELGDPFNPEQEALELGLTAPSTSGTLGNSASTVPTGEVDDDGDNEASFWSLALKVIGDVFGALYTKPVTDITTEPVVPCSCSPGIKFQVPQSSSSSGTGGGTSQQQSSTGTTANGWTNTSSGSTSSSSSSSGSGGGWFGGLFKKPQASSSTGSSSTATATSSSTGTPSGSSPSPSSDPATPSPSFPSSPAPSSQPSPGPAAPPMPPAEPATPSTPPAEPAPPAPPAEPAAPQTPPAEPAPSPAPPAEPAAPAPAP
jgi:hypothetical protein